MILSTCSKTSCLSTGKKINFNPPCFPGEFAKICKLLILGTLGTPGYAHWNDYCQLVENFDVYLLAKKSTSSVAPFLRHYILKDPASCIGTQHCGPYLENQNFARYGIGGQISIIITFHFRLIRWKTNKKIFQKSKKNYFGAISGSFCQNGKNIFMEKMAVSF